MTDMEAKELMIGDILDLSTEGKEITPCIVTELRYDELVVMWGNDKSCDIVGYDMVRPIYLTAEILEKNEWDIDTHCYANLDLKDSFSSLEFYFHESRLRKYWEGVDEWDNHNQVREITFQCHCNYVHELQRALRCCGLEDLADNFKIN